MPPSGELGGDLLAEAVLQLEHPRSRLSRIERRRKVLVVEHRRVDRLLQVDAEVREREEEDERPLVLLVAAGRAERERLAVAPGERRRERRPRSLARLERARQAFLQPEHLAAGAEAETEAGDNRRSVEPATAGRRGDDVAPAVDHVHMARVTPAGGLADPGDRSAATGIRGK